MNLAKTFAMTGFWVFLAGFICNAVALNQTAVRSRPEDLQNAARGNMNQRG